ncbi:aldo/keto reductase [Thalassospira tepidiphila]|uniref:Aldo/keto reductase n=2 Tax=Thalassospira tepidiphila TaxID=393657 RepID=A0A853KWY8_9PROT|nr:aldo/keto reductase [Thalassospira tepidiphila]NJB76116.1 diketogulonate reductase-like aldo/keto reductase [Thalassospira tepidiphila]OAZ08204.1 aldo/keto reductase [Thalassospira tepidiphila MCCC 1A03514]
MSEFDRRGFLKASASLGALGLLASGVPAWAQGSSDARASEVLQKKIPSTGEEIPAVGLGSWITFNVGQDIELRNQCADVMSAFFDAGGRMIDSSPMYGSAQDVIGYGLDKLGARDRVFSTDKVWTAGDGAEQIAETSDRWKIEQFDLLQVHNLLGINENLPLLFRMKDERQLRHVGVTTSHGRRTEDLIAVMKNERLDFVQVTYNPIDRKVEDYLLPLAYDRGIAVIVNRPFRGGSLTERLEGQPMPEFAAELEAKSWAQLILKYLIAHPAVTCPIPATTKPAHAAENMAAATGPLPDDKMREQIAAVIGVLV